MHATGRAIAEAKRGRDESRQRERFLCSREAREAWEFRDSMHRTCQVRAAGLSDIQKLSQAACPFELVSGGVWVRYRAVGWLLPEACPTGTTRTQIGARTPTS